MSAPSKQSARTLWVLLACTALCYAIGYPLALIGRSAVGWIFVGLGGPLLIALGILTIRRVRPTGAAEDAAGADTERPPGASSQL